MRKQAARKRADWTLPSLRNTDSPSPSALFSATKNPPKTCIRDSINMQKKPHNHSC
jgi:hypothetical protein